MRRISGALVSLALVAGPAMAEPDPAALAEAAARVVADPRAAADFAACPGDI